MTTRRPTSGENTARRRNAKATREALLTEGERLFAQYGFEGVSLEKLGDRVGVNKTLISYHFKSKKGLYAAVIVSIIQDVMDAISCRLHEVDDASENFRQHVRALVFSFAERQTFCAILMREYIGGSGVYDEESFHHVLKLFRQTEKLYKDGLAQGKFKELNPHLLHLSVVGPIVHFVVSRNFRDQSLANVASDIDNPSVEMFAAHHQQMIMEGLILKP